MERRATETSARQQRLRIHYVHPDVIEVEGVRYAGDLFRRLGDLLIGSVFTIVNREDGVLTLQVVRTMKEFEEASRGQTDQ